MSEQVEALTLLFADISGSTRLIQAWGDQVAHGFIERCLERVARAARDHGGEVRASIGDELMCTFAGPRQAVLAALEIQARVQAGGLAGDYPADVRMHIGLHHGPILTQGTQLFGDTIHVAKRLVDLAKTDQILTTLGTLEAAGQIPGIEARLTDHVRIKGYDDPVEIYEILRQDLSVTLVAERTPTAEAAEQYVSCLLEYSDQSFILDAARPLLSVGREPGNDLMIPESCVSRHHGHLEYQKGRIIYVDESTNGTSVLEGEATEPVLVRREQRWLRGQGLLRFGRADDETGRLTLRYRCARSSSRSRR